MLAIEVEMDNRERQFRTEQAGKPLGDHFGTGFDYLLQRLRPEMDNEDRVVQANVHATMIRKRMVALKEDLDNRNLASDATSYHISVVLDGLDLIEEMIAKGNSSPRSQNQIDLLCDGFATNINEVKTLINELDRKLSSPID